MRWPSKYNAEFLFSQPAPSAMKIALTAVALATSLALPAFAQNLAIVNGKPVPTSRMAAFERQATETGRAFDDNVKAQVKQDLIVREIFAQEAERRGIKGSLRYRQAAELTLQAVLIRELFDDFQRKNPVTDADIKAEYDKFTAANAGQEFKSRHILVESESEAQALIEQIKKGAKFEELAQKASKDPGSGANGGDLDWANPSNFVPEFSQAMIKLSKGQMTDTPVKSQFGWHIIRVDDVRQAALPPLAEIKTQIADQLKQQKLQKYQQELQQQAKVK
jgi:peptidyl-prolyl cis-trans isomerase C